MASTTLRKVFLWPHPGAKMVQLAGTFNSWAPKDMILKDNVWVIEVDVPIGNHEFKFVVDGEWVHDAEQASIQNEMGSFNNFIEVNKLDISSSTITAKMPKTKMKKVIEVERKFSVPENFNLLLTSKGFKPVEEFTETLEDEYFDTPEYELLVHDHWLRLRNKHWELKYPVGKGSSHDPDHNKKGSTIYHECSVHEEIMSRLSSLDSALFSSSAASLAEMVSENRLTPFAKLETRRSSYKRENVNIMVDDTDWGFRVGEVEVVVNSEDEVSQAKRTVDKVATELEFNGLDFVSYCKTLVGDL